MHLDSKMLCCAMCSMKMSGHTQGSSSQQRGQRPRIIGDSVKLLLSSDTTIDKQQLPPITSLAKLLPSARVPDPRGVQGTSSESTWLAEKGMFVHYPQCLQLVQFDESHIENADLPMNSDHLRVAAGIGISSGGKGVLRRPELSKGWACHAPAHLAL